MLDLKKKNRKLRVFRRNVFFLVLLLSFISLICVGYAIRAGVATQKNQEVFQEALEINGTIAQVASYGSRKSDQIVEIGIATANCIISDTNKKAVTLVTVAKEKAAAIEKNNYYQIPSKEFDAKLTFPLDITDSERNLLYHLVNGEAGNEPVSGQAAVCWVVLNRLACPEYPDTIRGVIFQDNPIQFSCTVDGNYEKAPSLTVKNTVDAVLAGSIPDPTTGALTFCNPSIANHMNYFNSLEKSVKIGGHQFYY